MTSDPQRKVNRKKTGISGIKGISSLTVIREKEKKAEILHRSLFILQVLTYFTLTAIAKV